MKKNYQFLSGIISVAIFLFLAISVTYGAVSKYGFPGIYNASPISLNNGDGAALALDTNGKLVLSPSSTITVSSNSNLTLQNLTVNGTCTGCGSGGGESGASTTLLSDSNNWTGNQMFQGLNNLKGPIMVGTNASTTQMTDSNGYIANEIWFNNYIDGAYLAGIRQRDALPGQSATNTQLYFEGAGGGAGTASLSGGEGGLTIVAGGLGGIGTASTSPGKGGDVLLRGGVAGSSGIGGGGAPNGYGGANGGSLTISGGPGAGTGVDGTVAIGATWTSLLQLGSASTPVDIVGKIRSSNYFNTPGVSMTIDTDGAGIGIGTTYANLLYLGRAGGSLVIQSPTIIPASSTVYYTEIIDPASNYTIPTTGVDKVMFTSSLGGARALVIYATSTIPYGIVRKVEVGCQNSGQTIYIYKQNDLVNPIYTMTCNAPHIFEAELSAEMFNYTVDNGATTFK